VYVDKPTPGKPEFILIAICLFLDGILFFYIYQKTGFEMVRLLSIRFYFFVIMVIVTIFLVLFTCSVFTTKYAVTDSAIEIYSCFMKKEIRLQDVLAVRRFDWKKDFHNVRTCAKIFGLTTIVMRSGFIDKVVISPQSADHFIDEVKKRLKEIHETDRRK